MVFDPLYPGLTLLDPPVAVAEKAVANGIATLDGTANVPVGQLGNVPPGTPATATEVFIDQGASIGRWFADQDASPPAVLGTGLAGVPVMFDGSGAAFGIDGLNGMATKLASPGIINRNLHLTNENAGILLNSQNPELLWKFRLRTTVSSIRLFVGPTSSQGASVLSDTPDPFVTHQGLSYSTSRGDTTWHFVRNVAGVQTDLVDTGVTVDTSVVFLRQKNNFTADTMTMELLDSGFNVVASTTVAGLPTGGFDGQYFTELIVRQLTSSAREVLFYFANFVHVNP